MKSRIVWVAVVVAVVITLGVMYWFRTPHWQRCYSQVQGGMTVAEIRQIMGRDEDEPDDRVTETGEFERSWTFDRYGPRITIVFNRHGRSTYKEFGPGDCGVTPLMDKYIQK